MPAEDDQYTHERRRFRRFKISLELRFRLRSGVTGSGQVVNMSSGGVLFLGSGILPVGELIEADLHWPLLLNQTQPLQLRVRGIVVRSDEAGTALSISRHEFRTRK